jgi:hypothetical protein
MHRRVARDDLEASCSLKAKMSDNSAAAKVCIQLLFFSLCNTDKEIKALYSITKAILTRQAMYVKRNIEARSRNH